MKKKDNIMNDPLWYKDAIIYELHIKAFMDSNGDGIGDFPGLIEKLDYLQDLGVNTIWLLPFYPSPQRDDGYDISDYYNINSAYGNLRDFKRFMKEAKKRDLKVITELVLNHTSDQHPWFQRARRARPNSVYRDFYVWSDNSDKYKDTRIIFTDTESSNWSWDPVAKAYYWHRFFSHQPDLNFDNPRVKQEIFKIIDFWLDIGVDGFRLDAVPYLFEREYTNCENLPETHEFLKELRAHVDSKYENKLLLAEANMWPDEAAEYFGEGDECHMNYHFPLMPRMFMALKMEDRYPIIDIFDQTPEIPENCQWAMFLRNHDELTLEMVTDEERDYMYKMYTKDVQARINVGIRHRLAPLLENNRKKIELMNTLLFSLPGTPVLYYGDEIGMGDNHYLGDRDGVRTPMQWSADRNAGFSHTNPQKLYLPVILDPEFSYEAVNVETQQKNPSSLLWWMKRVLNMRKRFKAFSRGDIQFLAPSNAKILAFTRTYEDETILVVANLSRFSQSAEVNMREFSNFIPEEIFSQNKFPRIKEAPYHFTLNPHAYYWFLLKKEHLMVNGNGQSKKSEVILNDFTEIMSDDIRKQLEDYVLPGYLKQCRWFGGKARNITGVEILHKITFSKDQEKVAWLILEVSYNQGLPEIYQLPVAFAAKESAEVIKTEHPVGIITDAIINGQEGKFYDAVYSKDFREGLFRHFTGRKRFKVNKDGQQLFSVTPEARKKTPPKEEINSRVLSTEQSNTSIIYNDRFFFKLYRKIDKGINPDIELTKYLTQTAGLKSVPKYYGEIEYQSDSEKYMLGMLQELIPNQGDAWDYFKDVIERFFERVLTEGNSKHELPLKGTLVQPVGFEHLDPEIQKLIGHTLYERVTLLGQRTAEMHIALASHPNEPGFEPESFSLHYQRSLLSSMQALLRQSFESLERVSEDLPGHIKEEVEELREMKPDMVNTLRKIISHKIDTIKIRTHGDYHLGQILFTGKDFLIIDFEGEPARTFSARRIKRSPLSDVAGLLRSFHYAAYSVLLQNYRQREKDTEYLEKWIEQLTHYVSGFFMRSYLKTVKNKDLLPGNHEEIELLLEVFLLEKSIYELGYELNNRPDWVIIPTRGLKFVMKNSYGRNYRKTAKSYEEIES